MGGGNSRGGVNGIPGCGEHHDSITSKRGAARLGCLANSFDSTLIPLCIHAGLQMLNYRSRLDNAIAHQCRGGILESRCVGDSWAGGNN